ncbi:MAG: hypothetical protein HYS08_00140 [Chlamydiae bacterium]|nr:hypothetical protein [Chlamydiota bacterium]MBI3266960.1 hypothetical protein [Chlamydiota bacterium]
MIKRLLDVRNLSLVCLIFLLFPRLAQSEQDEPVALLAKVAKKLNWPENVFIAPRDSSGVQIYGIATVPFQDLTRSKEKSSLQLILGSPETIQKIFLRHQRIYRRLGFRLVSLASIPSAYHALLIRCTENGARLLKNSLLIIQENPFEIHSQGFWIGGDAKSHFL